MLGLGLAQSAKAVVYTWSGNGADGNWNNAANWNTLPTSAVTSDLVFTGSNYLTTNTNNFTAASSFRHITFDSGAGAFTLAGNSIVWAFSTVGGAITGNISTSSLTTVDSGATLGGSGTVGKAIINGTLAVGNSPGTMTFTDTLGLNGSTEMEIDGTLGAGVTGGHDFINLTGAGAAGVLTYGGALTLDMGTIFATGIYTWNLFDMASETGTFTANFKMLSIHIIRAPQ